MENFSKPNGYKNINTSQIKKKKLSYWEMIKNYIYPKNK